MRYSQHLNKSTSPEVFNCSKTTYNKHCWNNSFKKNIRKFIISHFSPHWNENSGRKKWILIKYCHFTFHERSHCGSSWYNRILRWVVRIVGYFESSVSRLWVDGSNIEIGRRQSHFARFFHAHPCKPLWVSV